LGQSVEYSARATGGVADADSVFDAAGFSREATFSGSFAAGFSVESVFAGGSPDLSAEGFVSVAAGLSDDGFVLESADCSLADLFSAAVVVVAAATVCAVVVVEPLEAVLAGLLSQPVTDQTLKTKNEPTSAIDRDMGKDSVAAAETAGGQNQAGAYNR